MHCVLCVSFTKINYILGNHPINPKADRPQQSSDNSYLDNSKRPPLPKDGPQSGIIIGIVTHHISSATTNHISSATTYHISSPTTYHISSATTNHISSATTYHISSPTTYHIFSANAHHISSATTPRKVRIAVFVQPKLNYSSPP